MWLLFVILTIISTTLHLYLYASGKDTRLVMALSFIGLSLTLCAEYSLVSDWVKHEDWAALLDVVPITEKVVWLFTSIIIICNTIPLWLTKRHNDTVHE